MASLRPRSFQVSVKGSLLQVTEAASGVPQGSSLGPILFVVYVNDLTDNLTIDHLLYADDVKLIAPRKQSDTLQSSLVASSKWSEDWDLEDAIQASSPIHSRDCQVLESVQKRAGKFVKGLRHVPHETAFQRLRLVSLVRRRIRGDLICMYKSMHDFLEFPCDAVFAAPTRIELRGHTFKIYQQWCNTRRRQHAPSFRVFPN